MKAIRTMMAAGAVALGALQVQADLVNGIKAVVDESVITYQEAEALDEQTADLLYRQYAGQPARLEAKLEQVRAENLKERIERQLILREFKTAGYALPESVVDDLVRERIRAKFGNRMTLTKTLQERGMTYEKFRQQVREQFIVEQLKLKNVSQSKIIISPHKIEAYYQAHLNDFKVEDQVKLRMIMLNKAPGEKAPQARRLAEDILGRIKDGLAFADAAKTYSQDPHQKEGGDWNWVERSVLRKELRETAFALKPGQRSDVIETDDACYLLLVEDARAAHSRPLSEVRQQIDSALVIEERSRLERQWIDRLRKKTFVRYI